MILTYVNTARKPPARRLKQYVRTRERRTRCAKEHAHNTSDYNRASTRTKSAITIARPRALPCLRLCYSITSPPRAAYRHQPSGLGWSRVGCLLSTVLLSTILVSTLWGKSLTLPLPRPQDPGPLVPQPVARTFSNFSAILVPFIFSSFFQWRV